MDPDQYRFILFPLSFDKCNVIAVIQKTLESDHPEGPKFGGEGCFCLFHHQGFHVLAVLNEVLDGDQQHFVAIGKFSQLGITRHRTVFIHDFTDHSSGLQTCEPG